MNAFLPSVEDMRRPEGNEVGSAAPEWWALARGAQSGVAAAGLMPCDGVLRRAHEHG
jgi:hypothetical protein